MGAKVGPDPKPIVDLSPKGKGSAVANFTAVVVPEAAVEALRAGEVSVTSNETGRLARIRIRSSCSGVLPSGDRAHQGRHRRDSERRDRGFQLADRSARIVL